MKTTISILAACIVAEFSVQAQNLIINGSFESPPIPTNSVQNTTPTGWTGNINGYAIFNGAQHARPLPLDGQQYLSVANSPDDIISQTFTTATPGTYVLSWFDAAEANPGDISPYVVSVLDASLQTVASTNLDAWHPGVWVAHSMQVTLGSGTNTLQLRGNRPGGHFGTASMFDSVSLVPDNSDLVANIHVSAVDVCWAGRTNQMYKVQFKTSLSGTNWVDLTSAMAGTGTNCVTDGVNGNDQRYYRVVRVP
jgi:hypothetical protein